MSNPFDSKSLNVSVSTNNATGYYMTMSTTNDNTNLVNTNNPDYYIPKLPGSGSTPDCSTGCSETDFPVNKWGYKIGESSVYLPFVSGVTVAENTTPAISDTTNLTFASKVDYDTRAGLYATTLNFTAVSKPVPVYMQYITSSACTATPLLVTDIRDGEEYYIQRLDDGKCWMLDNLNLDLTDESIVANLTTENTNIDTTNDPYALESLKNGARSNGDKYATAGLTRSNWTSGYTFSAPRVNKEGVCSTSAGMPCVWRSDKIGSTYHNYDTISTFADNSAFGVGSNKIGIYYNYCATTVGTYCYGDGADSGTSAVGNATSDICPANWRLPTGGSEASSDYNTLCKAINGGTDCSGFTSMTATNANSLQYKLSTPLSGHYDSGYAYRQGVYGLFWASTYMDNREMHTLATASDYVQPHANTMRYNGRSIRCLLQE